MSDMTKFNINIEALRQHLVEYETGEIAKSVGLSLIQQIVNEVAALEQERDEYKKWWNEDKPTLDAVIGAVNLAVSQRDTLQSDLAEHKRVLGELVELFNEKSCFTCNHCEASESKGYCWCNSKGINVDNLHDRLCGNYDPCDELDDNHPAVQASALVSAANGQQDAADNEVDS